MHGVRCCCSGLAPFSSDAHPGYGHRHVLVLHTATADAVRVCCVGGCPELSELRSWRVRGLGIAVRLPAVTGCVSVTGCVVKCGIGSIGWKSVRQATVSRSTTESEYIAAGELAKVIQYLHQLARELGLDPQCIPIGCELCLYLPKHCVSM